MTQVEIKHVRGLLQNTLSEAATHKRISEDERKQHRDARRLLMQSVDALKERLSGEREQHRGARMLLLLAEEKIAALQARYDRSGLEVQHLQADLAQLHVELAGRVELPSVTHRR